jgi:hypothetical protein
MIAATAAAAAESNTGRAGGAWPCVWGAAAGGGGVGSAAMAHTLRHACMNLYDGRYRRGMRDFSGWGMDGRRTFVPRSSGERE